MEDHEKARIKAYTRAKHTMTLMGTTGVVTLAGCQIAEIDGMIVERQEGIDNLKKQINDLQERRAETKAVMAGYQQALQEKR